VKVKNTFYFLVIVLSIYIFSLYSASKWLELEDTTSENLTWWQFLLWFFASTGAYLALLQIKKKWFSGKKFKTASIIERVFLEIAMISCIVFGTALVVAPLLDKFSFTWGLIVLGVLILSLILGRLFFCKVWIHNLIWMVIIGGTGIMVGTAMPWKDAIIVLAVLTVYDFVAVYKTKHMIKMMEGMTAAGLIPGIIFPRDKISAFAEGLKGIDLEKIGGDFFLIGGGDIFIPLLLITSLLKDNLGSVIITAELSLAGIFLALLEVTRSKKPVPGLIFIVPCSLLGVLISKLI